MKASAASLALLAVFVLATVAALVIGITLRPDNAIPMDTFRVLSIVGFSAFAVVGAFLTWKKPGNSIGWLFLAGSVASAVSSALGELALSQASSASAWVVYGSDSLFLLGLSLVLLVPALFPTGRFLSRRWRWIGASFGLGVVLIQLWTWSSPCSNVVLRFPDAGTLQPDCAQPVEDWFVRFANPMGFTIPDDGGGLAALLGAFGGLPLIVAVLAGVVSLFVRYRRGTSQVRAQLRWLVAVLALLFPTFIVLFVMDLSGLDSGSHVGDWLFPIAFLVAVVGIPLATGVAIVRHQLFDIDVVISKTVTYVVLAAFITGVYALLVVGVGSLLGSGNEPNLALSIVAVAIVAVAFEPLRNRVQRTANRLVFGKRASPYEVLAQATRRLADAGTPEETLAQVTHLVAEGTGALATVLWVKVGGHLQPHSATPEGALSGLGPVSLVGEWMPEIPGEAVIPVLHRQELLGALTITKPRGQSVTGADQRVLADVAAGSGLLLRNIGLNVALAERAEQLRVSRRRLVVAQDAERHRLERDLHDGAQQQVVALKVKLGIARTLAEREGADKIVEIVTDLASTTQEAVDVMRAVAHGIYPPLLEAEGLEAALAPGRRTFSVAIDFSFESVGRYERSLEESVYFCVVEIITRAIDGGAGTISVSLVGSARSIEFMIRHDGEIGDLVAVEDRIDALEGRLQDGGDAAEGFVCGTLPSTRPVLETA